MVCKNPPILTVWEYPVQNSRARAHDLTNDLPHFALQVLQLGFVSQEHAQEVEEITSRRSVISTSGLKQARWKSESGRNHLTEATREAGQLLGHCWRRSPGRKPEKIISAEGNGK